MKKDDWTKKRNLNKQQTTHLLRLLAVSADIFRCVYDKNKLPEGSVNADDHIAGLKKKIDKSNYFLSDISLYDSISIIQMR